jgi:hypothetical protein
VSNINEPIGNFSFVFELMHQYRRNLRDFPATIIYVRSLTIATKLYNHLKESAPEIFKQAMSKYFADYIDEVGRQTLIIRFNQESGNREYLLKIIVCTVSLGKGLDKPHVRLVIVWGLACWSLEDLLQMFGRAGRDGQLAICMLMFSAQELKKKPVKKRAEKKEHVDEIKPAVRNLVSSAFLLKPPMCIRRLLLSELYSQLPLLHVKRHWSALALRTDTLFCCSVCSSQFAQLATDAALNIRDLVTRAAEEAVNSIGANADKVATAVAASAASTYVGAAAEESVVVKAAAAVEAAAHAVKESGGTAKDVLQSAVQAVPPVIAEARKAVATSRKQVEIANSAVLKA